MLADVKRWNTDPTMLTILSFMGSPGKPIRIGKGLYTRCGFNFSNHIADSDVSDADGHYEDFPECGVVDYPEQFSELFGAAVDSAPEPYAVGFTAVYRAEQPLEGGWRWHKWGQYYGKHTPKHEYLHDEKDIDVVYTFSVVQLVP